MRIAAESEGHQMAIQKACHHESTAIGVRQELDRLRTILAQTNDELERLRQENISLKGTLTIETDARHRLQLERDHLSTELNRYAEHAVKAEVQFRRKWQRFENAREAVLRTVQTIVDS